MLLSILLTFTTRLSGLVTNLERKSRFNHHPAKKKVYGNNKFCPLQPVIRTICFLANKLLKIDDIIKVEQLKLVFDFKNKNLPIDLLDLFKLNSDINSHITRNVSKGGIFIPQIKTTNFGIKTLRYLATVLWNNFNKDNRIIKIFLCPYIRKTNLYVHLLLLLLLFVLTLPALPALTRLTRASLVTLVTLATLVFCICFCFCFYLCFCCCFCYYLK